MAATPAPADRPNVWRLLLRARLLQVIFMVSVTANFALTGTTEVALPALAHDRFGADGYGVLLACVAVGSLAGTALVTRIGRAVRPAVLIVAAFVTSAVGIALVPVFDDLPGVAAAMLIFGVACGFDSVLSITLLQEWAPDGMLGRVMALIMLASAVSFPLSTAAAGLLTRHLGPESVFPVAGVLLAAAMLGGMTQREFRAFGLSDTAGGTAGSLATRPVRPSCRRLRTAPRIPAAPKRTCYPPGSRRGHAKVRNRQCPRRARQRYGPGEARGTHRRRGSRM
jgi:MFS family permease